MNAINTLEKSGEQPSLVLRDDSFLQLQRHILQDLAGVVRKVQVTNLHTKIKKA